jgi:hypothetical protein
MIIKRHFSCRPHRSATLKTPLERPRARRRPLPLARGVGGSPSTPRQHAAVARSKA